ncbi:hypothetical protein BDQ17DRAFT_1420265 [Cyathus striatus]|nr:hypothetical protein BDQ17DRAFT_1420265 [Cyathus striatus]
MSTIASFLSSFIGTAYNDEEKPPKSLRLPRKSRKKRRRRSLRTYEHPAIRDECKEKNCAKLAAHFEHCQEKVQAGEGFKGEDCVEELLSNATRSVHDTDRCFTRLSTPVHMMHCIDDCAAPKLFAKLK